MLFQHHTATPHPRDDSIVNQHSTSTATAVLPCLAPRGLRSECCSSSAARDEQTVAATGFDRWEGGPDDQNDQLELS